jgi:serine/threonine protein kinase
MAPEVVAHNHEYTKSVDIWATGIIMHEILTGGKHPLYVYKEDNAETYKQKLKRLEEFEVPSYFSWIAKNLFLKLTKVQSLQRYTASQALQHPWITRKNEGNIPITMCDKNTHIGYQ